MSIYEPFVYLVGWSELDLFYYGARYRKKTTPADLWTKYFTSSKEVAKLRKTNGEPDVIQVRRTFISADEARDWEHKVLRRLDVVKNSKFLNKTTGRCPTFAGGHHTAEHIAKLKNKKFTEEHKAKIRAGLVGKIVLSDRQRAIISESNRLRGCKPETRAKLALVQKTAVQREAVASANSKRVITDEYRANLRAGHARRKAMKLALIRVDAL